MSPKRNLIVLQDITKRISRDIDFCILTEITPLIFPDYQLAISYNLPGKTQSKWDCYNERMFCTISFKSATIPKVIEHIWFYIVVP